MTKNELEAVIRVVEQLTYEAYMRGYEDAANARDPTKKERFKMGPGSVLLFQREMRKR